MVITTEVILKALIICVYSYFIGSIPFGKIIGILKGKDVQKIGSGKTGATNVSRALGRWWGFLSGVLDATKGALAVILTLHYFPGPWLISWQMELYAGLALLFSVAGHILPVWLKFKGGAGISTFLGGLLGLLILGRLDWWFFPVVFICWFFVIRFIARKQMSTANLLILALILVFIAFIPVFVAMSPFIVAIVGLIWWAHRENLKRIREGKEPSIKLLNKIPITDDGIGWLANKIEWLANKLQALSKKVQNSRKKPG
jgi:acyl phosphate:glycerol-3-phosphate acyltransferase